MTPLRWRASARQLNRWSRLPAARIPSALKRSGTEFRPRTSQWHAASERVLASQSRGSGLPYGLPVRSSSPTTQIPARKAIKSPIGPGQRILHSAFPTKTVLALLALGTVAFFLIDVEDDAEWEWADALTRSFIEPWASPLQFYQDHEALDHWLEYHIPDYSIKARNPEELRILNERFAAVVGGWAMSEESSKDWYIPITHGCRFQSNSPGEDFLAIGTAPGPGGKPWNYWSIYDGHAGNDTALHLQWHLHPSLSVALSNLSPISSPALIESTIKNVFLKIDSDLMSRARHAASWYPTANASAIQALRPAMSGSCALLAAFDPESRKLRVACTGDSRAVLGRWDAVENKYTAVPLSEDQTGFNQSEVERITQEHPDEPDIIDPKSGRLLGIAVTRAFGDHRWKWDNDFVQKVQTKFWGTAPRPGSKTPPYMTAEPVITETDIVSANVPSPASHAPKSDFLIMASDGLWDRISSAHAVECVERWLEARARGGGRVSQDPKLEPPVFTASLNPEPGLNDDVPPGKEVSWKATPEYFAIEDDNAAVCLVRNAMGGTRRGLTMGLLSMGPPLSRYAVDDTTIMVIFFDHVEPSKDGPLAEGRKPKRSWWPWTTLWDAEVAGEA